MSNYGLVTRAFPADYWAAHGDEILDTANELHDDRWSARESRSLLAHGLRTRSLAATGGSTAQIWVQCVALVMFVTVLGWVATSAAHVLGDNTPAASREYLLENVIGLLVLVQLTRSTRWTSLCALAAVFVLTLTFASWSPGATPFIAALVILALGAVIARTRRDRAVMPARLAVVLGTLHFAALTIDVYLLGLMPLIFIPIGLLTVRLEPRIIGCAAVSTLLSIGFFLLFGPADATSTGPSAAIQFGVLGTVAATTVALTHIGNRSLQRTT